MARPTSQPTKRLPNKTQATSRTTQKKTLQSPKQILQKRTQEQPEISIKLPPKQLTQKEIDTIEKRNKIYATYTDKNGKTKTYLKEERQYYPNGSLKSIKYREVRNKKDKWAGTHKFYQSGKNRFIENTGLGQEKDIEAKKAKLQQDKIDKEFLRRTRDRDFGEQYQKDVRKRDTLIRKQQTESAKLRTNINIFNKQIDQLNQLEQAKARYYNIYRPNENRLKNRYYAEKVFSPIIPIVKADENGNNRTNISYNNVSNNLGNNNNLQKDKKESYKEFYKELFREGKSDITKLKNKSDKFKIEESEKWKRFTEAYRPDESKYTKKPDLKNLKLKEFTDYYKGSLQSLKPTTELPKDVSKHMYKEFIVPTVIGTGEAIEKAPSRFGSYIQQTGKRLLPEESIAINNLRKNIKKDLMTKKGISESDLPNFLKEEKNKDNNISEKEMQTIITYASIYGFSKLIKLVPPTMQKWLIRSIAGTQDIKFLLNPTISNLAEAGVTEAFLDFAGVKGARTIARSIGGKRFPTITEVSDFPKQLRETTTKKFDASGDKILTLTGSGAGYEPYYGAEPNIRGSKGIEAQKIPFAQGQYGSTFDYIDGDIISRSGSFTTNPERNPLYWKNQLFKSKSDNFIESEPINIKSIMNAIKDSKSKHIAIDFDETLVGTNGKYLRPSGLKLLNELKSAGYDISIYSAGSKSRVNKQIKEWNLDKYFKNIKTGESYSSNGQTTRKPIENIGADVLIDNDALQIFQQKQEGYIGIKVDNFNKLDNKKEVKRAPITDWLLKNRAYDITEAIRFKPKPNQFKNPTDYFKAVEDYSRKIEQDVTALAPRSLTKTQQAEDELWNTKAINFIGQTNDKTVRIKIGEAKNGLPIYLNKNDEGFSDYIKTIMNWKRKSWNSQLSENDIISKSMAERAKIKWDLIQKGDERFTGINNPLDNSGKKHIKDVERIALALNKELGYNIHPNIIKSFAEVHDINKEQFMNHNTAKLLAKGIKEGEYDFITSVKNLNNIDKKYLADIVQYDEKPPTNLKNMVFRTPDSIKYAGKYLTPEQKLIINADRIARFGKSADPAMIFKIKDKTLKQKDILEILNLNNRQSKRDILKENNIIIEQSKIDQERALQKQKETYEYYKRTGYNTIYPTTYSPNYAPSTYKPYNYKPITYSAKYSPKTYNRLNYNPRYAKAYAPTIYTPTAYTPKTYTYQYTPAKTPTTYTTIYRHKAKETKKKRTPLAFENKKLTGFSPLFYDSTGNKVYGEVYETQEDAIDAGMDITDNTNANKFIIHKRKDYKLKKHSKFGTPNKFKKVGNSFVEKRYHRYDKPNERNGNFNIFPYI